MTPAAPGSAAGRDASGRVSPEAVSAEAMTRIVLRPVASSLPLGFLAFGVGTVLLTALELQWVPLAQGRSLMVLVLAFVVPLEALAGVFAFLARDGGAATGLSLLAAAWAGTALTVLGGAPGARSAALGIFLLTLAATMAVLVAGSLQAKPLFGVLLAAGAGRFALTGLYEVIGGTKTLETVSGWIGVPVVAFALYGGLALLLEDGAQRTVLPLGRRGRARSSLEGDFGSQIAQAEQEAGIRRQL
jgi:hypothetical protein